eukprot:Hpha_TRINITY_DN16364_c3_g4::TRINITY_DN16364_c3_g4_i2::g.61108::m.61108/K17914/KIF13; kinesin family member 13
MPAVPRAAGKSPPPRSSKKSGNHVAPEKAGRTRSNSKTGHLRPRPGSAPSGAETPTPPEGLFNGTRNSYSPASPLVPELSVSGSPGAGKKGKRDVQVLVMVRVRPVLSQERARAGEDGPSSKRNPRPKGVAATKSPTSPPQPHPDEDDDYVLEMVDDKNILVRDPESKEASSQHTVDRVFWSECDNAEVYEVAAKPCVASAVDAYNVCLFAYGQTSSGKTHTMLGVAGHEGIAPMMIRDLFASLEAAESKVPGLRWTVQASFMEIYNERVRDLFDDESDSSGHKSSVLQMHYTDASSSSLPAIIASQYRERKVREHPIRGIFVDGLTVKESKSAQDCVKSMRAGMRERCTAPTKLNPHSSRSHAIFQIKLLLNNEYTGMYRCSTINLVDLAGSENVQRSGAAEMRFEEAARINQSLSTLRLVFDKLIDLQRTGGKGVHVPYRDSILTRVLQDSLGGNSKTVMIANVSPHASNVVETRSTLTYAVKATAITCRVKRNEEQNKTLVDGLRGEIEMLRQQLVMIRDQWNLNDDAKKVLEGELTEELSRRTDAFNEQRKFLRDERYADAASRERELVKENNALRAKLEALEDASAEKRTGTSPVDFGGGLEPGSSGVAGSGAGKGNEGLCSRCGRESAGRGRGQQGLKQENEDLLSRVETLEGLLDDCRHDLQRAEHRSADLQTVIQRKNLEKEALQRLLGQTTRAQHSTGRKRMGDTTARLVASVVCDEDPEKQEANAALNALEARKEERGKSEVQEPPEKPSMPQGFLPVSFKELTEHALGSGVGRIA